MHKLGGLYKAIMSVPIYQNSHTAVHWLQLGCLITILEMHEHHYVVHTHLGVFCVLSPWVGPKSIEKVA